MKASYIFEAMTASESIKKFIRSHTKNDFQRSKLLRSIITDLLKMEQIVKQMSIPQSHNLFLVGDPENDDNNNRLLNVGNTYSDFDPVFAKQSLCWELSGRDVQKGLLANVPSFGVPVKEIEYYSDVLYRAQFSVKFENGDGHVCAKIRREIFTENSPVNEFSYYIITNGNSRFYGNIIPAVVIQDIVSQSGWLKVVADLAMHQDENIYF